GPASRQVRDALHGEAQEVGDLHDHAGQLGGDGAADTLDVPCLASGRVVDQAAHAARRAVLTAPAGLGAVDVAAALRAVGRLGDRGLGAVALGGEHALDARDHVARTAHHHGVADAHVHAVDLVGVVHGDVGDRRAADEDGIEHGARRDGAGPPDLPDHV